VRIPLGAVALAVLVGCGADGAGPRVIPPEAWLNPQVKENCDELEQLRATEAAYEDQLPRGFPLLPGAQPEGWVRQGRFEKVRLSFDGAHGEAKEFYEKTLVEEGWSVQNRFSGNDPTGEYSTVILDQRVRGAVTVVSCFEDPVEIVVEYAEKRS
jgi:hypothetical protein